MILFQCGDGKGHRVVTIEISDYDESGTAGRAAVR
jgi:hypothetical protein